MTQTTQKGQISPFRVLLAVLTAGLSILFVGIRKPLGRSKKIVTREDG